MTERPRRMSIGEPHALPRESVNAGRRDLRVRVVATGIAVTRSVYLFSTHLNLSVSSCWGTRVLSIREACAAKRTSVGTCSETLGPRFSYGFVLEAPASRGFQNILFSINYFLIPPDSHSGAGLNKWTLREQMPRAWGDTHGDAPAPYLTLTRTQYSLLNQWRIGSFIADWRGEPPLPTEPDITPEGLDRASLESCVGGAFFPGIEVSWLVRNPLNYVEPFRIKHGAKISITVAGELTIGPGYFSQQLALPWQADFADCHAYGDETNDGILFAWWPGQRPDDVFLEQGGSEMLEWARGLVTEDVPGDTDEQKWHRAMVEKWSTRGFVIRADGRYVEREGP